MNNDQYHGDEHLQWCDFCEYQDMEVCMATLEEDFICEEFWLKTQSLDKEKETES